MADRNYRMTKGTKTFLATMTDVHERGLWKSAFVAAESFYAAKRKSAQVKSMPRDTDDE